MADILRTVEFRELLGTAKRAELGPGRVRWGAYIDTGAGRTVISERVARSVRMPRAPMTIEYVVPIKVPVKTSMTAMRLVLDGCGSFLPILVAVSDKVIGALDLPGVEVLVGQDYLQAARVRLDLAPKGEKERLVCRAARTASFTRERERERARRAAEDDAWTMTVKGSHWYVTGPNVKLATGSLRHGDRPPSIAHFEVEVPGKGTGTAVLRRVLRAFHDAGERELVTTGQTSEGEAFFQAMERKGLLQKIGRARNRFGDEEIRYRF